MVQTTSQVGRMKLAHPDRGFDTSDSGVALHAAITEIYRQLSDHSLGRYFNQSFTVGQTVTFTHNFGMNLPSLTVFIHDGDSMIQIGSSPSWTLNTIDSNSFSITNNTGSVKTIQVNVLPYSAKNVSDSSEKSLSEIAGIEPTLDLQFRSMSDFYNAGGVFTRSSIATYFGEDGLLKYAQQDEGRCESDPSTGDKTGLLIEETRTNYLTHTEHFDNSAWPKGRSFFAKNVEVAPDGSMTATKLIEDSTAANTHYTAATYSVTSGTTYTFSVFAKAGERTFIQLILASAGFTVNTGPIIDLSNGTISSLGGGTHTDKIESVGNGWYKISVTATATASASCTFQLRICATGSTSVYDGDGKSGLYIWGAQLEAGAFPTSYIPSAQSFLGRQPFSSIAYASKSYAPGEAAIAGSSAVIFKPDGTKMFIGCAGGATDPIYQYTLSTPWDVSTASYDSVSFNDSGSGSPYGFRFNNDGTKAFRYFNDGNVREYTLSSVYNLSTMSYASVSYNTGNINCIGMAFSSDGSYMFLCDVNTDKVYQFTLATPWSLASVTSSGELSVSAVDLAMYGIEFDSTGKICVMCGNGNDSLYIFVLGTAWDITTAKLVTTKSIASEDSAPISVFIKPDKTALYVLGSNADDVFQYTCVPTVGAVTYYDNAGILQTTTDNAVARYTYNPSPDKLHLAPKLLLEPERTNLFIQSADLSLDGSLVNVSVSSTTAATPDGNTSAKNILLTATSTSGSRKTKSYIPTAGKAFTVSSFVKKGTYTGSDISLRDLTEAGVAIINIDTKSVVSVSGIAISAGIVELPNGWYRIYASFLPTTGGSSHNINPVYFSDPTSSQTLYCWGMQLEEGYGSTSYIATTSATVTRYEDLYTSTGLTRASDNASISGKAFTDFYRFDEGTMYCEADGYRTSAYTSSRFWSIHKFGVSSDTILMSYTTTVVGGYIQNVGSATYDGSTTSSYTQGTTVKTVLGYSQNSTNSAISGTLGTDDTSSIIPKTMDTLMIGHGHTFGNRMMTGHIKRLAFFPKRLSNSILQAMSAKTVSFDDSDKNLVQFIGDIIPSGTDPITSYSNAGYVTSTSTVPPSSLASVVSLTLTPGNYLISAHGTYVHSSTTSVTFYLVLGDVPISTDELGLSANINSSIQRCIPVTVRSTTTVSIRTQCSDTIDGALNEISAIRLGNA